MYTLLDGLGILVFLTVLFAALLTIYWFAAPRSEIE